MSNVSCFRDKRSRAGRDGSETDNDSVFSVNVVFEKMKLNQKPPTIEKYF